MTRVFFNIHPIRISYNLKSIKCYLTLDINQFYGDVKKKFNSTVKLSNMLTNLKPCLETQL